MTSTHRYNHYDSQLCSSFSAPGLSRCGPLSWDRSVISFWWSTAPLTSSSTVGSMLNSGEGLCSTEAQVLAEYRHWVKLRRLTTIY